MKYLSAGFSFACLTKNHHELTDYPFYFSVCRAARKLSVIDDESVEIFSADCFQ